jgi:hypothetical protein
MKAIAQERHESFDSRRRSADALAADAEELEALEAIEKRTKPKEDGQ